MTLVEIAPETHTVNAAGKRVGTVARVQLPGAGWGWLAWDAAGNELDVFGATAEQAALALA
jgi:hypothetical protein